MRRALALAVLSAGCGRFGFEERVDATPIDATPLDAPPLDARFHVAIQIAAALDDVEEADDGVMYVDSTDLELCDDLSSPHLMQTVGMRFVGIPAPRGAKVIHAAIQFTVEGPPLGVPGMQALRGELAPARPFTITDGDLSVRVRTATSITWVPPQWSVPGASGPDQRTPELAPIIEEILARPEWIAGGAIAIFVTGTGTNQAQAFEGAPALAPRLELEYEP